MSASVHSEDGDDVGVLELLYPGFVLFNMYERSYEGLSEPLT